MPPKSLLWAFYTGNKTLYLTDQTHQNAWCNACLSTHKRACRESDIVKVAAGELAVARTEIELGIQGQQEQKLHL